MMSATWSDRLIAAVILGTLVTTASCLSDTAVAVPAFPGAEGYGASSVGGRSGKIIEVTNLRDSGPGSLRAAIDTRGARIVIFRVGGTITLKSSLLIRHPFITIAGQTAPGGGITLRMKANTHGPPVRLVGAHDVIIRYLHLRAGKHIADNPNRIDDDPETRRDNLAIRDGARIIIDHVSAQWSTDENMSNSPTKPGTNIHDVTFQRCILAETLEPHSTSSITSRYGEYDQIVDRVSFHHNLFAHSNHRNPRIASHLPAISGIRSQVVNNVVYNWGHRVGETKGAARTDFYGNYWKLGPMSNRNNVYLHEHVDGRGRLPDPSIYIQNNLVDPAFADPRRDNWRLITFGFSGSGYSAGNRLPLKWRRLAPLRGANAPIYPVTLQSPYKVYESIVQERNVGSNSRLDEDGHLILNIDAVDQQILNDAKNRTGPRTEEEMDHPNDFGGYPVVDPGTPYEDSDHDGMADQWERRYGLDRKDPLDGAKDTDGDGYTNVEEFLNGTKPSTRERAQIANY